MCPNILPHCAAAQFRTLPHSKFFIGFLDELGNFKHFETYFFFGDFWAKNRQFGDLAIASAIWDKKITNFAIYTI